MCICCRHSRDVIAAGDMFHPNHGINVNLFLGIAKKQAVPYLNGLWGSRVDHGYLRPPGWFQAICVHNGWRLILLTIDSYNRIHITWARVEIIGIKIHNTDRLQTAVETKYNMWLTKFYLVKTQHTRKLSWQFYLLSLSCRVAMTIAKGLLAPRSLYGVAGGHVMSS